MKDALTYKGYVGSVRFNAEDAVFFGKIEGIDDFVTFEGDSVKSLKTAFEEAVDDYIDLCSRNGKKPEKSYKGGFNVRMPSELHGKAKRTAVKRGISLNRFIQQAVENELAKTKGS